MQLASNREWRRRRTEAFLCVQCGKPSEPSRAHCAACLAKRCADYPRSENPKRVLHCSECGAEGHNARTCLRRQVYGA